MARKRMFDSEIISQDSFLDLPMEAKALYFLLGMEADDEGFVSPKKVLRMYGGTEDSLKILVAKSFIIPFKSGVVVITDWKRNNYLDKNKLKATIYQEEKRELVYDFETQKYQRLNESLTKVKPKLNESLPSIVESSIEENSIEENSSSSVENPLYNSNVEKIDKLMIETLNTTNTNNILECVEYLDKLPYELIEYGLKKTARIANPSWKYAIKILDDYVAKGFSTLEQVKGAELSYKSRNVPQKEETKEEKAKGKDKCNKKGNFEQRDYRDLDFLYANKNMLGER